MKLKAATELVDSKNKMLGYVALMDYYFHQLCIKGEGEALLPVEVEFLGETKKIEEVTLGVILGEGEADEDKIYVYPKDNDYISAIIEGVKKVHAEFKIDLVKSETGQQQDAQEEEQQEQVAFGSKEIKTEEQNVEDSDDGEAYHYIQLTMPEVDKDKKKLYHDLVGQIFDSTKLKLDAEKAKLIAKLVPITATYVDKDRDEVDDAVKNQYDEAKKQAEDIRKAKDEEIDRGYERYLKKHGGVDPSAGNSNSAGDKSENQPSDGTQKSAFEPGKSLKL